LTAHHGEPVFAWLNRVPVLLAEASRRWGLRLHGYHDAGHASVVATARADDGELAVLKAWFDRERYANETAALRHWEPVNGRVVRIQDDERAVACLDLVGGVPAGVPRPVGGDELVAAALRTLHGHPLPEGDVPCLDAYLAAVVEPRIRRRARRFAGHVPRQCVDLGLDALTGRPVSGTTALLHTDLYQENVPFGGDGRPVFLDPIPMRGDTAFDWAFFIVYYDIANGLVRRLRLACKASGQPVDLLLPWCLMLCLDGLLYYHEVGDGRELRMAEAMAALAAEGLLT
jgi:streptomycin 6-kinase